MYPKQIDYIIPKNIEDLLSMLNSYSNAKVIAGGQFLTNLIKSNMIDLDVLIDISRIKELNFVKLDGNELIIGANLTLNEISNNDTIKSKAAALAKAALSVADIQIRSLATIAGNICSAYRYRDIPSALLALEASINKISLNKEESLDAQEFFIDSLNTKCSYNEIVKSVSLRADSKRSNYIKLRELNSERSIVSMALALFESSNESYIGIGVSAFFDKPIYIKYIIDDKKVDAREIYNEMMSRYESIIIKDDIPLEYRKRAIKKVIDKLIADTFSDYKDLRLILNG
ncbi:MAG: glyceraldehyde dehydrogenase medium chain [Candidatus Micrarchaeota archaeon]|nr:MAG: glyceraldehyde dehydrogenase medium chain [Candidatus Micrarchaeota archaeon]